MVKLKIFEAFEFRGEDVIMVSMDNEGLSLFRKLMHDTIDTGEGFAKIDTVFYKTVPGKQVALYENDAYVELILPLIEMNNLIIILDGLTSENCPGHGYLDVGKPSKSLVLSLNEGY